MMRIAKYIKPYLPLLAAAIVLLFIQAYANLSLPDYMSHIVNVGIQQGGVADAVPKALRKSQMDSLTLFMSATDAKRVLADYQLVQPGGSQSTRYLSDYPALREEPIYVRGEINTAEIAAINPIMGKAWLVVAAIEQARENPAMAKDMGLPEIGAEVGTGASDLFSLLKMLPAERRSEIASSIDRKFASMGPKMISQAATQPVKAEYAALGVNTAKLQTSYMLHTGVIMLLLTLIAAVTAVSTGFLSARIAAGLARDLRAAVFQRVEDFGAGEFDKFSTASLITRSTNDIMQIQMVAVMLVTMAFYAPIIGVGGIIRAIDKSASMWWIIALAVAVLMVAVLAVYKVAVPKFKLIQRLIDRLNLVSREALSGMMVIRAFNMQPHEENRFDSANKDLTSTMLFVNRVMVGMMPFMFLIMNGLSVLIIWVGAGQVDRSTMQVGDMIAFMQYAIQIVFAFLMLSMMFIMLPRAAVSAGRVADVLETEPLIKDPPSPESFAPEYDGTVEFRNVSFRYPGAEEDVLHDISFTAGPGQTTAIIGPTGAGKSTLVMLIPRFYDVTGGAIYVGGKDVRAVNQHDLRDRMGYVPQKAALFAGTIASNLRYADEQASDKEVESAASISQASEFIATLPGGMKATISQGGVNVSGGQKQRLSIARALVKKPPIYIFDDSFSALDFKTDANLRRALKKQTASSIVLIVTQRVSTIKNAEQIIVLDEGRVVGRGTHRELMDTCVTYREIATSQLTTEELA
jgi:ATP-binding cassette subfamily B multidrug efflux pump